MGYPLHILHQTGEYSITQGKKFFAILLIDYFISNNTTGSILNEKTKKGIGIPPLWTIAMGHERCNNNTTSGKTSIPRYSYHPQMSAHQQYPVTYSRTPIPKHSFFKKENENEQTRRNAPWGWRRERPSNTTERLTQYLAREFQEEWNIPGDTINTFLPLSTRCINTPLWLLFFPLYCVIATLSNEHTHSDEHKNSVSMPYLICLAYEKTQSKMQHSLLT